MNHHERYVKILTVMQTIVNDELETMPETPNVLQYIEMKKVLNRVIHDIDELQNDLRIR